MRLVSAALGLPVAVAALLFSLPARATTLFWEDFEGYSHFPSQIPLGDPVNVGLPEISEGADGGLRLAGTTLSTSGKSVLKIAVNGGTRGGQQFRIRSIVNGAARPVESDDGSADRSRSR